MRAKMYYSIYDWGVDTPEGSDSLGLDFWPMLWGGDDSRISAFESAMQTKGLGTIILGFNEYVTMICF